MANLVLTHLGESEPPYLRSCVEQARLWNQETAIWLILEPMHRRSSFYTTLASEQRVRLIFTDELKPTDHHQAFLSGYAADLKFRKGYWRQVKERFFFVEELMLSEGLTNVFMMEYDVLLYTDLNTLLHKLKGPKALRYVMDNREKGHPAFIYIPEVSQIHALNLFFRDIVKEPLEDMQTLAAFANRFPEKVRTLPVLPTAVQKSRPIRKNKMGREESQCDYLSTDFDNLGCLFDSLCLGQAVGGVDPRNTDGKKVDSYENESAMYSVKEMRFAWKKSEQNFLWEPTLDGYPVVMLHCHCKALHCFKSDRRDVPRADYDVSSLLAGLLSN